MSTNSGGARGNLSPESQNDGADNPIAWLITRYLLVCGGLGTMEVVLQFIPPGGLAYYYISGLLERKSVLETSEAYSGGCGWVLTVSMLAGGLLLWHKQSLYVRAMWIVCPLVILHVCAQELVWLAIGYGGFGFTLGMLIGNMVGDLGSCAAAVTVLWFVGRGRRAPRDVIRLIGAVLLMIGILESTKMGLGAKHALDVYRWANASWRSAVNWSAYMVFLLMCVAAGAWLVTLPRKRLLTVAAWLLFGAISTAIARCLRMSEFTMSSGQSLISTLRASQYPLTALVFLWFVLRYKRTLYADESACRVCGYLLRGLPTGGHNCPECGAFFVRRAPEAPGLCGT